MGAIFSPIARTPVTVLPPPPPAQPSEPAIDRDGVEQEAAAAARRAYLARRNNGRLGTIATSARGILNAGQLAITRRSLLGE